VECLRLTDAEEVPAPLRRRLNDYLFSAEAFAELWRTAGGSPVWWLARSEEEAVAVVPGVEFGFGPIQRFQAMPDGCFHQPAITDHDSANRGYHELVDTIFSHGYAKAYLTDYASNVEQVPEGTESMSHETTLVEVDDSSWRPPDTKLQSQIRKAEREGIAVQRFDYHRHMRCFMGLVEETGRRQEQAPRYGPEFYECLASMSDNDKRILWWYVEHDGHPVASQINFDLGDQLLSWQTFSDRSFSHLKANQFLLSRLCREAAARSIKFVNLGLSPPDAEGLEYYKRRWGGSSYSYRTYFRKSGLGRLL